MVHITCVNSLYHNIFKIKTQCILGYLFWYPINSKKWTIHFQKAANHHANASAINAQVTLKGQGPTQHTAMWERQSCESSEHSNCDKHKQTWKN